MIEPVSTFPNVTKKERIALATLRRADPAQHDGLVTRSALMDALYGDDLDAPADKIIDVWMSKLRSKLDIEITCIWGKGYALPPESRAALDERFGALERVAGIDAAAPASLPGVAA